MSFTQKTGGTKEFHYTKEDLQRIEGKDTLPTKKFKEEYKKWVEKEKIISLPVEEMPHFAKSKKGKSPNIKTIHENELLETYIRPYVHRVIELCRGEGKILAHEWIEGREINYPTKGHYDGDLFAYGYIYLSGYHYRNPSGSILDKEKITKEFEQFLFLFEKALQEFAWMSEDILDILQEAVTPLQDDFGISSYYKKYLNLREKFKFKPKPVVETPKQVRPPPVQEGHKREDVTPPPKSPPKKPQETSPTKQTKKLIPVYPVWIIWFIIAIIIIAIKGNPNALYTWLVLAVAVTLGIYLRNKGVRKGIL